MLDFANNHVEAMNRLNQLTATDMKYMYYNINAYSNLIFEPEKDTWNKVTFVSLNKSGEVKGFITVKFDNPQRSVSLTMLNTEDNLFFLLDVKELVRRLFLEHKTPRISFVGLVGNPIIPFYDKIVEKLGGRCWGTSTNSSVAYDGSICSVKHYEIIREDYINKMRKEKK